MSGLCDAAPLKVARFNGKFAWIKVAALPPTTVRSLGSAKSLNLVVVFPKDVHLKPDSRGNQWFTFIAADQGSDWTWHQTKGYGVVPATGGLIKAGSYTVRVPLAGIPKSVLTDKKQTISLGPGASGLASPIAFQVEILAK
jgi:hypothetical protein